VAIALKPSRNGEPHSQYFANLNQEMQASNSHKPTMLIDLDIVDQNIANMKGILNRKAAHRIPVKSLPSIDMVRYFMRKASTDRLMVFHIPFLHTVAQNFPSSDVLFGKPMPVGAARSYYQARDAASTFDPSTQLQWLIDTHDRLLQYLALAVRLDTKMRINIEIDVGLHRGGLAAPEDLNALLDTIKANPKHLEFSGFMGYDPQVVKLPSIIQSVDDAYAESQAIYQSFIDAALAHELEFELSGLCLNGSGSPTLLLHKEQTVCNDLTAGSCIVKPTDFDIDTLASMSPAAFIATPVLKKHDGLKVPGVGDVSSLVSLWNPNREQTFYIYGGAWMANYASPQGLIDNRTVTILCFYARINANLYFCNSAICVPFAMAV